MHPCSRTPIGLLLLLAGGLAFAAPEVGQPIPALIIDDRGEAVIVDDELEFQPWATESLRGRWTLIQYLAARTSARKINRPALDRITAAAEAQASRDYLLLNIINVDDVIFGATGIAMSILKKNKIRYPDSPMIADMDKGRALWGLQRKGSAIFLLDEAGTVRFFKDGALDDADINQIVRMLREPQTAQLDP